MSNARSAAQEILAETCERGVGYSRPKQHGCKPGPRQLDRTMAEFAAQECFRGKLGRFIQHQHAEERAARAGGTRHQNEARL